MMLTVLSLALRNLRRNSRRSLATLLALTVGAAATLLFGGFKTRIEQVMHTYHVQAGGHLQIQHRDFHLHGSGDPAAYGIADQEAMLAAILGDEALGPIVLVATPTLQFTGVAGNHAAGVSRTVIGNGFVARDINRMRLWDDYSLPYPLLGHFALEGSPEDSAVVGVGVARVLQLCGALRVERCPRPEKAVPRQMDDDAGAMPDDIALLSRQEDAIPTTGEGADGRGVELLIGNARGSPNVASLAVIRAEPQGFKERDEVYMMMHLAKLQQLIYGKSPPKATSIMVQLRHTDQIPLALQRLGVVLRRFSAAQPLVVRDFRELNPFYVKTIGMFDTIFGFIFVLIGAIVLFTVGNTMGSAVVERTVEIGTLRAMGLRRAGVRAMFVTEGAVLGVLGAALGVALALGLAAAFNAAGLTWLPPANSDWVPLTLAVWGESGMLAGTAAGLVAIAVCSAWWPARRAAGLNVVDALRHA